MSGFNKVTSFVLGLIVVIVFFFVFGSRINVTDKLLAFKNTKVTPTPTKTVTKITPTPSKTATKATPTPKKGFFESLFGKKATPTPTPEMTYQPQATSASSPRQSSGQAWQGNSSSGSIQQIPNTGSPTLLIPILISAFGSGIYLRRKS